MDFKTRFRSLLPYGNPFEGFQFQNCDVDLFGWGGEDKIFNELISKYKPKIIAEVGTYKGQSAINMAKALKNSKIDGHIVCIDTWLGSSEFYFNHGQGGRELCFDYGYPTIYYQFLVNVCHHGMQDYITPVPLPSVVAAEVFKGRNIQFDMIYIDGDHSFDSVSTDIRLYHNLLSPNGVMFGHDLNWDGVKAAVYDFCKTRNKTLIKKDNFFWMISN